MAVSRVIKTFSSWLDMVREHVGRFHRSGGEEQREFISGSEEELDVLLRFTEEGVEKGNSMRSEM